MILSENSSIEVHDLTVNYHEKPVLWNIDFSLPMGKLIGIIGPNGAGKSTLLKAMMGLVPLQSGYVKLFGSNLEQVRSRVSYVPQRESVDWDFPASVMDIVLMGRYRRGNWWWQYNAADRAIAKRALEEVDMLPFAGRQIAQLSGGQQQRVFIARALAQQADLYLMDEPFAGVDASSEAAILALITDMCKRGKTVIVVHHDLQSAYQFFDWVLLLNRRLVAVGEKETTFTEELLQETYGARSALLTKITNIIRTHQLPVRE